MGDRLWVGKPSWYVTSPGRFSLLPFTFQNGRSSEDEFPGNIFFNLSILFLSQLGTHSGAYHVACVVSTAAVPGVAAVSSVTCR